MQADAQYRAHRDNLNLFYLRSGSGTMVPVTTLGKTHYTTGPVSTNSCRVNEGSFKS